MPSETFRSTFDTNHLNLSDDSKITSLTVATVARRWPVFFHGLATVATTNTEVIFDSILSQLVLAQLVVERRAADPQRFGGFRAIIILLAQHADDFRDFLLVAQPVG